MENKKEITFERVFNVSQQTLFEAWTDEKQIEKWWGPKGFSNTFEMFDLKPNGVWKFVMHGPDGADYENESVFIEIKEPERLVFKHTVDPNFVMTAVFEVLGEKSRLIWTTLYESEIDAAKRNFLLEMNKQNLDRLEAFLDGKAVI